MKIFFIFFLIAIVNSFAQQLPQISYNDPSRPTIRIHTKSQEQDQLKLYTKIGDKITEFPVLGDYNFRDSTLTFQPLFPLSYDAKFVLMTRDTIMDFQLTKKKYQPEVKPVSIYPTSSQIPSNILTFYIEFEETMIPDPRAYQYVEIIDNTGQSIALPWREKSFWINDNKTLVLMIHPGRVKKGIQTTYNLEPIFVEGKTYTIRISKGLRSANNQQFTQAITYTYEVIGADTISPKLEYCDFKSIQANSKTALQIRFNEPMDFGLIYKWIEVTRSGEKVPGTFYSPDGLNWLFTPQQNWREGDYAVSIANKTGDLSHNQQDRLFEIDKETDFSHVDYVTFSFSLLDK